MGNIIAHLYINKISLQEEKKERRITRQNSLIGDMESNAQMEGLPSDSSFIYVTSRKAVYEGIDVRVNISDGVNLLKFTSD